MPTITGAADRTRCRGMNMLDANQSPKLVCVFGLRQTMIVVSGEGGNWGGGLAPQLRYETTTIV